MNEVKVFNPQKTTEAVAYLIQLHGDEEPIKFIKVLKLLYLADREALRRWERQITNDDFYSMEHGQVLSHTYDLMKRSASSDYWDKFIQQTMYYWIGLRKPVKLKHLSPAEVELLEEIYADYGEYEEFDLAELTHELPEYEDPGKSSIRTPLDKILRVLDFNEADIERILEEFKEQARLDAILGG